MTIHHQLTIDRVESAVLLSLIGGGLIVCASAHGFMILRDCFRFGERRVATDLLRTRD
jgi:hypothetical protein